MGAEASNATFFTSVFFVAALACFAISFIMWWFPYHLFSDEVYNIIGVNHLNYKRKAVKLLCRKESR